MPPSSPSPGLRLLSGFVLSFGIFAVAGCAAVPQWRSSAEMRAPDGDVAFALGDTWRGPSRAFDPTAVPDPPEPTNLRPCCAFGADLKVQLGVVVVPGFSLDNIRGPEDVGAHRFNIAPFGSSSSAEPGALARENNGLLYTCRGGFLDLAHVRDYADLTVYLSARIERLLETGGTIDLAAAGGTRRIVVRAVDGERIADAGRNHLALALAQWLAFQVSIWHEIATWYGFSSIATWPEKVSAFSPEDLYSNMLGIQLAAGVLSARNGSDETDYNNAIHAWMAVAFERLQVTPKASARAAIQAVDGHWWDSSRSIPDWKLVRRRNFDIQHSIKPWLVSAAFPRGRSPAVGCESAASPLRLRNPSGVDGVAFAQDATLEIEMDDVLVAGGFPLPRKGSRRITQADFPAIIAQIRRENAAEFGPGQDRPDQ